MKAKLHQSIKKHQVKLSVLTLLFALGGSNYALSQSLVNPLEEGTDFINQNTFDLTEFDKGLEEHSKELREKSTEMIGEDWIQKAMNPDPRMVQQAQGLIDSIQPTMPTYSSTPEEPEKKYENPLFSGDYEQIIFITYALGEQALYEILDDASVNENILVVMRGVPEGQNFYEGIKKIQEIAGAFNPVPNVIIDPELFKEFQIEVAPTIVQVELPYEKEKNHVLKSLENFQSVEDLELEHMDSINQLTAILDQNKYKEIARVEGLTSTTFLNRQIQSGEFGNFGKRGPVVEIAEPDLIEVMKQQAAQIDWEEQKEGAIKRVWHNQQFQYLSNAPRERIRLIDPSIIMQQDIITPNGEYIVRKGDVINPFDIRPMDFALVIFNPLEKKQIPIAKAHGERLKKLQGINQVMFLATETDKEGGWDYYNDLSDQLDEHVFLLTPDVKERFRLEYTPSLVQANNKQFMVTELHVPSEPEPTEIMQSMEISEEVSLGSIKE